MDQLDQAALKARNRLFLLFLVLCILDTVLIIMANDKWAIGRILLTMLVMYFVLQGKKWAKWLLIGICSLVVVILLAMVVALYAKLSSILIAGSLIMVVLSVIIPVYMVRDQDLNRYFSYKRRLSS